MSKVSLSKLTALVTVRFQTTGVQGFEERKDS